MIKAKVIRRRLDPRALDNLEQALTGPTTVAVGFPEGEVDPEIVERAARSEFGTRRQPERPFVRTTTAENAGLYRTLLRGAAERIMQGQTDMRRALEGIGEQVAADMREAITNASPGNAPSTVKRKGSAKVLHETGEMAAALTHKVEDR